MSKKRTIRRRGLSAVLALSVCFGLLPGTAGAAETGTVQDAVPAASVEINETNFPDAAFRAVVQEKDTDGNNALSDAEIAAATKISCKKKGITSLKGIEYFTELEDLYCHNNELTELDLSNNKALKELNCSTNRLTALDLRNNTELQMVICSENELTELNLSHHPELQRVDCSDNALTELDLRSNSKLTNLEAGGNVREITLTGNTFDLTNLPVFFDASRMSELTGGTVSGSILTVDENAAVVTYSYDTGCIKTGLENVVFTLAIAGRGTDIAIDEAHFPDPTFREILLSPEENFDRNRDSKLSTWEIALARELDIYDEDVRDFTGIGYFTELETLFCVGTKLTSLDLSRNTKLTELDVSHNDLTSLDLRKNTGLTKLNVSNNNLTSLDLSQNTNLTNPTNLNTDDNAYTIAPVDGRFHLPSLPSGFNVKKAGNWQGGTVSDNILTINSDATQVTYDYDCGNGHKAVFTLEIPAQFTVTAHGLYGGAMGITPGEDFTARYSVGAQVDLQIGIRDGFTLQGLTLEGISEDQLRWEAKDAESTIRGVSFNMPANDVTVTVNWQENGSSSGGSSSGGGGGGSASTYAITVNSAEHGAVTSSHRTAARGTAVTLTAVPDKGYVLDTIKAVDSRDQAVKLTEKNGKYTFTMPSGKVTVTPSFKAETQAFENPFTDVHAEDYYYDAVLWAAKEGVTGGTSDTLFAPNAGCTRAQAVTFLWRAAGSPEAKSADLPFTDVPADAYYAKAVAWAVENGVAKGVSETLFAPDAGCTRAQIVTFLWRAQQSPASGGENPFADVPAAAYYYNAVLWAVANDVAKGVSETAFAPNDNCTRAQIVTLIYRCRK